jgi:hypothetical protein
MIVTVVNRYVYLYIGLVWLQVQVPVLRICPHFALHLGDLPAFCVQKHVF